MGKSRLLDINGLFTFDVNVLRSKRLYYYDSAKKETIEMGISDIYSKRHKKLPDVFSYDSLPEKLKIQIEHIWKNFFDQINRDFAEKVWDAIHKGICEEHGKKTLLQDRFGQGTLHIYKVEHYFEQLTSVEEGLDIIELTFHFISKTPEISKKIYHTNFLGHYKPEQAIKDLNTRFLENGVGYEYKDGNIIRIDNTLLHKEIIIETLQFLS